MIKETENSLVKITNVIYIFTAQTSIHASKLY